VIAAASETGAEMATDAAWGPLLLSPLEIVGIESFADAAAIFRVKFKTQPLNQGKVANELRRRLMTTFADQGIRPFARGIRPFSGSKGQSTTTEGSEKAEGTAD